jgi:hypothetical protein
MSVFASFELRHRITKRMYMRIQYCKPLTHVDQRPLYRVLKVNTIKT